MWSEKRDNWEAKERALEEKVSDQERLLRELKASYAVESRLNNNKAGGGEEDAVARSGATAAELEIVGAELERTNLRLAEVEARNEQLRLKLAQAASGNGNGSGSKNVEDEPAYLRLQSENSSLLRRLENWRFEKDTEKRKWEADCRVLERELGTLRKDRDGLREKMGKWSDYENLRRELEVLKVSNHSFTQSIGQAGSAAC